MIDSAGIPGRCCNCYKPTDMGCELDGKKVRMCLQCRERLQRIQQAEHEHLLQQLDLNWSILQFQAGVPPLPARRPRPVTNNFNVSNSNIGVMNAGGTMGQAHGAVSDVRTGANEALQQLLHHVLKAPDASDEQKGQLARDLTTLSEHVRQPPEKRQPLDVGALLKNVQAGLAIIQSLKPVAAQWLPVLLQSVQSLF